MAVASLDFSDFKAALKTYMQTKSAFRDYNYDGANMSQQLDVLSFNTFQNAFYLNMVNSEMHLDSAQIRDSGVSRAKMLNYVPRSVRSSVAHLSLSVPTSDISTLTIPKGIQFTGTNANGTYSFVTRDTTVWPSASSTFTVDDLAVYEGAYLTESYVVDLRDETQRFLISNRGVDTESLTVSVTVAGSNAVYWTPATNLYGLGPDSNIYFLQGAETDSYEVVFGDGVLGAAPVDGALVTISYIASSGADANGIDTFTMDSDLGTINGGLILSPFVVATTTASFGGAAMESLASIQRYAPRHFQTQESAITTSDYADIVREKFVDVYDASVYGGETVTGSVEYGRIFVAVVGLNGAAITQARQKEIKDTLEGMAAPGMTVVLVDPVDLYVEPTVVVHADREILSMSTSQLTAVVTATISAFNAEYLGRFKTAFRFSKFTGAIDDSDAAVISCEVTTTIKKIVSPELYLKQPIRLSLNNPISSGVRSSEFVSLGKRYVFTDTITDKNVTGTIYMLEVNPAYTSPVYTSIGTVDYSTGEISIGSVVVSGYGGIEGIAFRATPSGQDIYANRNDVIQIDMGATLITATTS